METKNSSLWTGAVAAASNDKTSSSYNFKHGKKVHEKQTLHSILWLKTVGPYH